MATLWELFISEGTVMGNTSQACSEPAESVDNRDMNTQTVNSHRATAVHRAIGVLASISKTTYIARLEDGGIDDVLASVWTDLQASNIDAHHHDVLILAFHYLSQAQAFRTAAIGMS